MDICLSAGEVGFSGCLLEQQFWTVRLPQQRTAAGKYMDLQYHNKEGSI